MFSRIAWAILLSANFLSGPAWADDALDKELYDAIQPGDEAKVEALIARGANLNPANVSQTPLENAACGNNSKKTMVELLISHGADVNGKDEYGNSPLDSAAGCAYKDHSEEVATLLIAKGADVNARGQLGHTPLDSAVDSSNIAVMDLLISHGADINAKGTQKYADSAGFSTMHTDTPLGIAVIHTNKKAVELLITKGADVNAKNNDGETPLQVMGHIRKHDCLLPNYSMDKNCEATIKEITALLQGQADKGLSSSGLLKSYLAQFRDHSGNEEIRKSIIDLALKSKPALAIPDEAEAAAGRGAYIFKNAASIDDTLSAAKEYLSAIEMAPWVANYYYNLCTVLEKTPYKQQALHACKFYLVAAPNASDAGDMRQRIAGLQYATDRDKAQMKQRTAYLKHLGRDELYRTGGITGSVSGKEITMKLNADFLAAPPKYQLYVGCIENDGVSGETHDLVTTDNWIRMCNYPAVSMHLLIKPEGEGFVELSDANGGSLRTTFNELFSAKQKTMAQSNLSSLIDDKGGKYYVAYAQGGIDVKHAGFLMYQTDCNGTLLKQDPRALPDDFLPAYQIKNGGDRFLPEVDSFSTQPSVDVCTRQFSSKTGYHFGEME